MPLPMHLLLTFAAGVLAALTARSDLRGSPKPAWTSRAFVAYLLYAGLVLVPVSLYFYLFHGDWYLLYLADTERVPSAIVLLGALCEAGLGAVGFLIGATLIRTQRDQWAGAAIGATISLGVGLVPLVQARLSVVGTYRQFHNDFGLTPYGGPLLQGTAVMGFWMAVGLVYLVYRLGPGARRG